MQKRFLFCTDSIPASKCTQTVLGPSPLCSTVTVSLTYCLSFQFLTVTVLIYCISFLDFDFSYSSDLFEKALCCMLTLTISWDLIFSLRYLKIVSCTLMIAFCMYFLALFRFVLSWHVRFSSQSPIAHPFMLQFFQLILLEINLVVGLRIVISIVLFSPINISLLDSFIIAWRRTCWTFIFFTDWFPQ